MKKKFDPNSPEFRDLVSSLTQTKINLPSFSNSSTSLTSINKTLSNVKDTDLKILSELNDKDLFSFCIVNKYANRLCKDEHFWMNRFLERFGEPHKPDYMYWRKYYLQVVKDVNDLKDPWKFFDILFTRIGGIFRNIFRDPDINVWRMSQKQQNQYYYLDLGSHPIVFRLNQTTGDDLFIEREYKNLTPEKLLKMVSDFYRTPVPIEEFRQQKAARNPLTENLTEEDVKNGKVKRIDLFSFTEAKFSHVYFNKGKIYIQMSYGGDD